MDLSVEDSGSADLQFNHKRYQKEIPSKPKSEVAVRNLSGKGKHLYNRLQNIIGVAGTARVNN